MKKLTTTLLFLSLCFNNSNAQELETHDTKDYSISYPEDWTFDTSGQMNTTFIIFSQLELNDTFRENMNLMIQDLTNMNLDLEGYTKLSLKQIKAVPNYSIIESKDMKKGNITYHEIVWKGFVTGKNLKFKQFYYVRNEKAYLLTLTCEENKYDTYSKVGTKILNSFTLK